MKVPDNNERRLRWLERGKVAQRRVPVERWDAGHRLGRQDVRWSLLQHTPTFTVPA